jgi:hypothetical protein
MIIASMMGWNPTKIMWNRKKVTESVQKMLRPIITAALKWMLLPFVFNERIR